MKPNLIILAYCFYIPVAVFVTYWVGKSLYKNGRVFLELIFRQNVHLVSSVNKLLLTGYYLLNIGYVFILMVQRVSIANTTALLEVLSGRIGLLLLTLGIIHFFNLSVFYFISKRNQTINHT